MIMKTIYIYLLVALFGVHTTVAQEKEQPPKGGEPKDFNIPKKEVITLDNGLTLVMVPYGSIPKATIMVSIKSGNIHETEDEVWLASLMGKLLEEGSTSRTNAEIANEMAAMGGDLNLWVGMHTTSLNASVLYEFAPNALKVMADVLQNPAWPEGELSRLKNDMKRDLSVALTSPQSQAYSEFAREIYPDHAYGRIFPSPEQIDGYSIAQIKDFYDANYGAKRTTIYISGNFNKKEVVNAFRENFASWNEGPESFYPQAAPVTERKVKIIDRPGAPQSTIYFGLPTIDQSHPDHIAMDVTNSLLGGSFASRITSNIREDKGYTYSPGSVLSSNYRTGLWYEVADVTTEFTGASLEEIIKEIELLQNEPPSQQELDGIINYSSGLFVLQNSSPSGIISQLSNLNLHDLDESYLNNKVANMHKVTPELVQEMTKKYIRVEDMSIIIVGDKQQIEKQIHQDLKQ